jgi:hypothetical protein
LFESDLVADCHQEPNPEERQQQPRHPPTGATAQISEGLAGRDESIDDARALGEWFGLWSWYWDNGHCRHKRTSL